MSSGVDISAVVSRLKRQINKKQLKFASLTQEFNTVQEKYIEKDIVYNTTVEEIDKIELSHKDWWQPKIDKKVYKKLCQRSDAKAWFHTILYFGVLFILPFR